MPRVHIQLVSWNGEKYIPYLFESLRAQKFTDWELFVLDNGSADKTFGLISEESKKLSQPTQLIQKVKNIGFAPGHNELFRAALKTDAEYILLLNQDMCLDASFLEKLVFFCDAHPDVGAASGRLMKWAFPQKTEIIDSLGLKTFRSHRVIDMDGGHTWDEEDDVDALEVFGVSGALPLYRTEALREVAYEGEIFDEDFFSYKEDVDLAWRLKLAGWFAFTVLDAFAYHDRSASGPKNLSDKAARENRKFKSKLANFYSYRNHICMLIKNFHPVSFWGEILPTAWYECKKVVYLTFVDPRVVVQSWREIRRLMPRMKQKRAFIAAHTTVSPTQMAHWFE